MGKLPAGVGLFAFTVFVVLVIRITSCECEKARQGWGSATKSGNGLQKTSKLPRLAILTIILFFLKFSVAFVAGERKSLADKGLFEICPATGSATG